MAVKQSDVKKLLKALREANATPFEVRAASILLAVNGLESALRYVEGATKNRVRAL